MWVVFEGLDKSGKTTLEYAFLKRTNYEHIVVDRGPVGYMVFDKIFGRVRFTNNRKENFIWQARKMMKAKDFLIVYCKAPLDVVEERLKDHNEECPYNYKEAQKVYDEYINRFYFKRYVVEIDTTKSIDECVDLIVKKLEEVRKGEL